MRGRECWEREIEYRSICNTEKRTERKIKEVKNKIEVKREISRYMRREDRMMRGR